MKARKQASASAMRGPKKVRASLSAQSSVSCMYQHRDRPVELSHRVQWGMQDKQRPDTPIQRRRSARLAELPPPNQDLTGDEHERHGAVLLSLLHQQTCCMMVILHNVYL